MEFDEDEEAEGETLKRVNMEEALDQSELYYQTYFKEIQEAERSPKDQ